MRSNGSSFARWFASASVFPGGSFGNGSAMRIVPLAGYFAEDDYPMIAEQARLSAEVITTVSARSGTT